MAINSFRELEVWKRSIELAKCIYRLTDKLPRSELYGLTSQIRRSAVSIPSNIAEGYNRRNRKEFLQFLGIAYGSAAEAETQLVLIKELYLADDEQINNSFSLNTEIQKMLYSLMKKLSLETTN
jgi:four helix bundle protein